MNIAQLISRLKQLPQGAEVLMYDPDAVAFVPVTGYILDDKTCILQPDAP